MSSCNTCRYNRRCIESSREYPCIDYEERRKQDGRHKRADSPRSRNSGALEEASGTAPGAKEEGLSAAEVADHKPDPAGSYLHHGGGDLHSAGGTGVRR